MLEDDKAEITVGEFVEMLWKEWGGAALGEGGAASLTLSELLRYGHFRGWLEDSDESQPEKLLNRQTAARIIHQFMVVELGVADIADIREAEKLRDLYTCRVCANHVAQVYLRGIMRAQEMEVVDNSVSAAARAAQPVLFFNHLARVTRTEVREAMERLRSNRRQRAAVTPS